MGQPELLSQHIKPEIRERYDELLQYGPENYPIGHSQWGAVFGSLFSEMQPGGSKHLLLRSGNHDMSVELKVKQTETGSKQYVANFHDSNLTLTHQRIVEDSLDRVEKWQIETFLDSHAIEKYYGKEYSRDAEQVSHFLAVPENFEREPLSLLGLNARSETRLIETFLSDQEAANPARFHHLFAAGLPLAGLWQQLAKCKTPEERIKLLTASNASGTPGFHLALQKGNPGMIKAFGEIIFAARRKGWLTSEQNEQIETLLAARNADGTPGFYMTLKKGHLDAIREFKELIKEAWEAGWLTGEAVENLLTARNANGKPAFHVALQKNQIAAKRFGKVIEEMLSREVLLCSRAERLLAAVDSQGQPALMAAMLAEPEQVNAVEAFGKIVTEIRKAPGGYFDDVQMTDLLLAAHADSRKPALLSALEKGKTI